MPPKPSHADKILEILRTTGIARTRDIIGRGIHPEVLRRLHRQGRIEKISRGIYRPPEADIDLHHGLALATKQIPKGVICLLSALSYHGVGTQMPPQVWLAIDSHTNWPKIDYPPVKPLRFSDASFSAGVEEHVIDGVTVKIYSVAKTVADCFKFRNKIGLDVCLEALRDSLRDRRCTSDEIWKFARICRVAKVMLPYMEAMP